MIVGQVPITSILDVLGESKMAGFLEGHFDRLMLGAQGGVDDQAVAQGLMRSWNHDNADMGIILQALEILRPKVVIELGTFEGLGAMKIAGTLGSLGQESSFYTFDLGTGPWYEIEPIDWERSSLDTYLSWGDVIKKRNERLSKPYKNVAVEFVEGKTYSTLGPALERIGKWDFCFQDTVHHHDYIIKEWVLLKPYSKIGSVVVFDDMYRSNDINPLWVDMFRENEPDWVTKHSNEGHESFWAERIR